MSSGITIHVRFFASIREQLGCSQETATLPIEITTVGQVREWLMARGGVWMKTLAHDRLVQMAYQLEICDSSAVIMDGGEIAFFPPVTGG